MPRAGRIVGFVFMAAGAHAAFAAAAGPPEPPLAFRAANPRWISGGVYSALAAQGGFGRPLQVRARDAGVPDLSKGKPPVVLDARVGANLRLGADPSALPSNQRGQAEPHIARNAANPDVLLATFQEGRFAANGGAVDCGYALSRDGGLTWTRALIPQLTQASGGIYHRATDPVAGVGPQRDLYLSTLASLDDAFGSVALVVSRSTDNGVTWLPPSVAFQQVTPQAAPDKDWLAVNDFPGSANAGRLVVTWTNFTATAAGAATGNNLLAAVSDDRGATWSAPTAITPNGSLNQGTQPVFLPDGTLVVIYITFANATTETAFSIQCKRSSDGGHNFPAVATTVVAAVNGYADQDLRSGVFLPSAVVSRTSGEIFVSYVATVAGTPRVMLTKSADQGATWTVPVVASDNPVGTGVINPAVAVTPDGKTVSLAFMDKRNSPLAADGHRYFVDLYGALSFDGGATWQPNLRLSDLPSDVRNAPLTDEGYMLGDYLGIAPSIATGLSSSQTQLPQACVPIWCDTRSGDADPFIVTLAPLPAPNFDSWGVARNMKPPVFIADTDGDGVMDLVEYVNGTDPRRAESGEALVIRHVDSDHVDVSWTRRQGSFIDTDSRVFTTLSSDLSVPFGFQIPRAGGYLNSTTLTTGQLPSIVPPAGLVWQGVRFQIPANAARAATQVVDVLFRLDPSRGSDLAAFNTDSRLINLSTRGPIRPGGAPMIAGFVTRGEARSLLIRGVGPSLAAFGISTFAGDPLLALVTADGQLAAQNDDWQNVTLALRTLVADLQQQVGAFPLSDSHDAAIAAPGLLAGSYSAEVSNHAATGGSTALVEIYDGSPDTNGLLVNVSTRGEIGPPDNALIAGFVIGGTQPRRVLVRAIGPSLAQFNVAGAIADPMLTLYDSKNNVVASNDDWEISRSSAAIAATAQNIGAFALNPASLDAALLITLPPGAYTAVVTGVNGATGTALVEVYDAN